MRGWDGFLNKPNKPQASSTSQKKPRFYVSERVFSDSSTTSPLRKEEGAQERPTLKRKSQASSTIKITKELDRMKITKKQKQKKLKSKQRKKSPFEESSEGFGFSSKVPMRDTENNESSMLGSLLHEGSEM